MPTPSSQLRDYRESQKDFWDLNSVLETAENKGRTEARYETAAAMKREGISVSVISRVTGLDEGTVAGL